MKIRKKWIKTKIIYLQTGRRSRWGMKGLRIPSLIRSRSSESKTAAATTPTGRGGDEGGGGWLPDKQARSKMGFWKRKSANITDYDPTYRVIYLGNVLTGWAKGESVLPDFSKHLFLTYLFPHFIC